MLDLYRNIKKRRKELNISQQELAEAVGYKGKSMISQVEKGLVDLPESMIIKFADALKTTPYQLMGWQEIPEVATGHSSSVATVVTPGKDSERIKEAMDFLDQYEKASPEIQAAILTLLKAPKS